MGWGGVGGGAGKAGLSEAIHPLPTEMPEDPTAMRSFGMAVIPGGDEQLAVWGSDFTMRTFARDMSRRATIPVPNNRPEFAASEHFLYTAADHQLRSRTHDGTEVAVFGEGGKGICCPVLGPRGLLFCVLLDDADVDAVDEIFALDAR